MNFPRSRMEIIALGDSALSVRLRGNDGSGPTLDEILSVYARLEEAALPGTIELSSAYETVALFFDPVAVVRSGAPPDGVFDWLAAKIRRALDGERLAKPTPPRIVQIPVSYDAEFALDLEAVAANAKLSAEEVVALHSTAEYRVACVGFTPGFPYLVGLPARLATPRRATPRNKIPAGSVAIGGVQTGIYPQTSPGGWHVVGRAPVRLFDPQREPPALLEAGDHVRFRIITREEFKKLSR